MLTFLQDQKLDSFKEKKEKKRKFLMSSFYGLANLQD
jgi:hypothetical protein